MHMTWEWIAGFFEGEGHIQWVEGKKGTKQGTSGRIVIGQKDPRPLKAITVFLEQQGFSRVLLYLRKAGPLWILAINERKEVVQFLQQIGPRLFEKQAKATYVLKRLTKLMKERDDVLSKALALKQAGKTWEEIRILAHINYRTLNNYARSKGVELRIPPFSNKQWRDERMRRGLCASCGKPRCKKGTKRMCASCQTRNNERSKLWKRKQRQLSNT